MPTYKVTDPQTGVSLKLTGDSPPTEAELEQIFSQYAKPKQPANQQVFEQEKPGLAARVGLGFGRGVEQAIDDNRMGAAKSSKALFDAGAFGVSSSRLFNTPEQDQTVKNTSGALQANIDALGGEIKQKDELFKSTPLGDDTAANIGRGIGRVVDDVALTAPFSGLKLPALMATGGSIATAGNLQQQDTDKTAGIRDDISTLEALKEGAFFAGGEVLGVALSKAIGASVKAVAPKVKVFGSNGKFTDEAIAALDNVPPEQLQRIYAAQAENILTPDQMKNYNMLVDELGGATKAQVTRDTTDFAQQQQAIKLGGSVDNLIEGQSQAARGRMRGLQSEVSPDEFQTSVQLTKAITDQVDEADKAIDLAYQSARESLPDSQVQLSSVYDKLDELDAQDTLSGGAVSAVKGEVARLADEAGVIPVDQTETLRQAINKFYGNTNDKQSREVFRQLKSALDEDVAESVGKDFFKDARQLKAKLEGRLNRASKGRRDRNTKSFLRDVAENMVTEEEVFQKLALRANKDSIQNIKAYKNFLTDDTLSAAQKAQGQEALQSLKDQTMEYILEKSFKYEDELVSLAGFKQAVKRIGEPRLKEIMGAKDFGQIKRLEKALEQARPKNRTAQGAGPTGLGVEQLSGSLPGNSFIKDMLLGAKNIFDRRAINKAQTEFTRGTERAVNNIVNPAGLNAERSSRAILAPLGGASSGGI